MQGGHWGLPCQVLMNQPYSPPAFAQSRSQSQSQIFILTRTVKIHQVLLHMKYKLDITILIIINTYLKSLLKILLKITLNYTCFP